LIVLKPGLRLFLCLIGAVLSIFWLADNTVSAASGQYVYTIPSSVDNFVSNDQYSSLQQQESEWKAHAASHKQQKKNILRQRKRGITGVTQHLLHLLPPQYNHSTYPLCLTLYKSFRQADVRPGYYIHLFRYALF